MIFLKKKFVFMIAVFIFCSGSQAFAKEADTIPITQNEKISYALGFNIANNLKKDFNLNVDLFIKGVKTSLLNKKSLLIEKEMKEVINVFQNQIKVKQMEANKQNLEKNKADGTAFLEKNKKKKDVKTLKSGLQYKVIKKGKGVLPKDNDSIKCHYKGTTIDGKEFDSSYKRNQAAIFGINGVIKGFSEALKLMNVGSKWEIFIPSSLGYGDRGSGNIIPPGATLIFEIELLGIEK